MSHTVVLVCLPAPGLPSWSVRVERAGVLGRSSGCDIVVADQTASRRHAALAVGEEGVRVTDLGSRNGTFVEDTEIREADVAPGLRIRFGSVTFLVCAAVPPRGDPNSAGPTDVPRPDAPPELTATVDLTAALQRVFDNLTAGLSEKAVAAKLGLSLHTVHTHVRAIYRTYGVRSRAELMARLIPGRTEPGRLFAPHLRLSTLG